MPQRETYPKEEGLDVLGILAGFGLFAIVVILGVVGLRHIINLREDRVYCLTVEHWEKETGQKLSFGAYLEYTQRCRHAD